MSRDLTTTSPGAVDAAQPVRSRLPNLEPYLEAERLSLAYGARLQHPYHPPPAPDPRFATSDALQYRQERIAEGIRLNPSVTQAQALADILGAALDARPHRGIAQTAIALLLDTRTRMPLNPALYVEVGVRDVIELEFQPAGVVAACQHLRREATFTPEIAEIIAACRSVQSRYRQHKRWAEDAVPALRRIEAETNVACD